MTEGNAPTTGRSFAEDFVRHLVSLAEKDRGALAELRRSLSFEPGCYPAAYPYVERFVGPERHAMDPFRKALYLAAGIFARHPEQRAGQSLATAFGQLKIQRDSASIEKRFIALLAADPESLPDHLRHAASLLSAADIPIDYAILLVDLARWLDPYAREKLDEVRQRWARDFYRVLAPRDDAHNTQDVLNPTSD